MECESKSTALSRRKFESHRWFRVRLRGTEVIFYDAGAHLQRQEPVKNRDCKGVSEKEQGGRYQRGVGKPCSRALSDKWQRIGTRFEAYDKAAFA